MRDQTIARLPLLEHKTKEGTSTNTASQFRTEDHATTEASQSVNIHRKPENTHFKLISCTLGSNGRLYQPSAIKHVFHLRAHNIACGWYLW
jgi:hypothetical protein